MRLTCNIPESTVREIVNFGIKNNVDKIILFGSRARGDNLPKSDIDLAVSGGNHTGFWFDINDAVSTPLRFDIVDLDSKISPALLKSIINEGFSLYEKV